MERYLEIEIRKTDTGKRFYKTVKYPEIIKNITDIYIVGQTGDRIDY